MSEYAITLNLIANGTVAPSTFVKGDTANDLYYLQAGVGDKPIGISGTYTDKLPITGDAAAPEATIGETGLIYPAGASCQLVAGTGGWTPYVFLKPDASGFGVVAATGDFAGAYSLTAATAGEKRRVLVLQPGTKAP